ncbi:abortive phage infection protein [Streptomyces albidoflavus]|uniref:AIPR family protein n=1 Tax=Streptomyces albidoflavus TaxID=1886 RepID=UPI00101E3735|nr:AIPR family protein [Streptomyces albidoflavus]RZD66362.1 abortive phage infection protein [Streptomyces albidoflavus]
MSTTKTSTPRSDVALQVRQVEKTLRTTYESLLDVSDLEGKPEQERTPRLLSRALTAQAVRMVTGWSPQEAAYTVIDGMADQGIDAIAVVEKPEKHVYLIQAKWSANGKASSDRSAVQELLTGLRLIDDEDFAEFNPRGRVLAERAKAVMASGPVTVTQVIVLMRADDVTEGFRQAIKVGENEFNRNGEVLDHRIILSREVWGSVREDIAPKNVDLGVELFPWYSVSSPHVSYQGQVAAECVAQWLDHGDSLFNLNIRNPLGRTPINSALLQTLTEEPGNFWYFNNGVTVLCEEAEKTHQSMRAPERYPLGLTLRNASVVNGAQTVRAVAEALAAGDDAAVAQVGVRIIVTGKSEKFAKEVTQATNRQNKVEARDFIALDPVQASLMEEMRAELGLDYSVRRSELEPPEETGCSVVEAACALGCAHTDPQYAARMAVTLDVLWERGSQGIYDVLFRPQPSPYLVWNAVQVLRTVRKTLHRIRPRYERRGAALAEHGVYLLTHLVFRLLDAEAMDEPDPALGWAGSATTRAPELVNQLLPVLAAAIDARYTSRSQIRAVCSDAERCRELADDVVDALRGPRNGPVPDTYRRTTTQRKRRRPNAVRVIIDHGLLPEETPLTLNTAFAVERAALQEWLDADPRRSRATWLNHRTKPLLWAADGKQYSPSGLITHMWELADWKKRPVANQGPARWVLQGGDTLVDLAWRALDELENASDEESPTD